MIGSMDDLLLKVSNFPQENIFFYFYFILTLLLKIEIVQLSGSIIHFLVIIHFVIFQ